MTRAELEAAALARWPADPGEWPGGQTVEIPLTYATKFVSVKELRDEELVYLLRAPERDAELRRER